MKFEKDTKKRAGVSLVTVLMFMLVATIAATATYKWITSEGHSSAGRMMQREAYQSAIAGIENARSWMTYNANDFGALVTQYFSSGKKPILITPVSQASLNDKGQKYDVWLTGVEVKDDGQYKVQIFSAGEARNGSKHSEVAILNVIGLYRVKKPSQKKQAQTDFELNYFGGTTTTGGNLGAKSLLVNGDLNGANPVFVEKDLIVTGKVKMSASAIGVRGTACVAGDFDGNNGTYGGRFYIKGTAKHVNSVGSNEALETYSPLEEGKDESEKLDKTFQKFVTGDVYVEGNLEGTQTGDQEFPENLTLYGSWNPNSSHKASVGGNLCFYENGNVIFENYPTNDRAFFVKKNVVSKNNLPIVMTSKDADASNYGLITLGQSEGSKIYISSMKNSSEYSTYSNMTRGERGEKQTVYWPSYREYYVFSSYKPYKSVASSSDKYFFDANPINVEFKAKGGSQYANYYLNDRLLADQTYEEWDPHITELYPSNSSHGCKTKDRTKTRCSTASEYDVSFPECSVKPWVKSLANTSNIFTTAPTDAVMEQNCSEDLKEYCMDKLGEETTGCKDSDGNSTHYKVADILATTYDDFLKKANAGCNMSGWTFRTGIVQKLNDCYSVNSTGTNTSNLYEGYQVVSLNDGGTLGADDKGDDALEGKFIIIVNNSMGNQNLPAMSKTSEVFLYLKEGATGNISPLAGEGSSTYYNYFIFSEKDMSGDFNFGGTVFHGSIYLRAKNCAKLNKFQARTMEYNEELVKHLTEAGVICNDDGKGGCDGGSGGGGTTTETEVTVYEDSDIYHIATAPQLGVSLETQYESRENSPAGADGSELEPSILIMPRIIYLHTNPVGKLEDYYSVVNLNGASETKNPSKVTCPSAIKTNDYLYDGEALPAKSYTCSYQYNVENSSDVKSDVEFYVVVEGTTAESPWVSFETDFAELTTEADVPVKLKIPAASHGQFTVDVSFTSKPDGWIITPSSSVVPRGDDTYKVTVQENENTQTIFTVKANPGASTGSVAFQLQHPCNGCTIAPPNVEVVSMVGSAVVTRKSLADYCEEFSSNCDGNNNYEDIAKRPDCAPDQPWITAAGCATTEKNKEWKCGTNGTITLSALSYPDYCEIFIPEENNAITIPDEEGPNYLYASLKRKPRALTIQRKNATSSETKVKVFISTSNAFGDNPDYECSSDECVYTVYAGQNIKLTYDEGGDDKFAYWYSNSPNSPIPGGPSNATNLILSVTADNVVLAQFNAKDLHCFYEDFSNLTAFCVNNADVNCIASCATSASCEASVNATPKWQLGYNNGNGNPVAPTIHGGFIYGGNSPKPTLVMSNKHAGKNGVMMAMLQTTVLKPSSPSNLGANSGLVFRSNADASSYLILNILGQGTGYDGDLKARLCKFSGSGASSSLSSCTEFKTFSNTLKISPTSMIKVELTVTNQNLDVVATVDNQEGITTFDLEGNYDLSGEYVGMKLSDSYFKLYDIGWRSTSFYGESCWDIPSIYCSFKAGYLGGVVPQNEDVIPWVGASSWFDQNGCDFEYYYSGDDNLSASDSHTGIYKHQLRSSTYKFSREGLHGQTSDAMHNDAMISVSNCQNSTSLNNSNASCGLFQVGTIENCSAEYDILPSTGFPRSGISNVPLVIETPNPTIGVNLRASELEFSIEGLSSDDVITVYLEDVSGNRSLSGYVKNGSGAINVNVLSAVESFDPQHVKSIVMNGTSNYMVKSISSKCEFVFGFGKCESVYNGTSWVVKVEINNRLGAKEPGCFVSSSDADVQSAIENAPVNLSNGVNCPSEGVFTIQDEGFYNRLNANNTSSQQAVSFTIEGKNKDDESVKPCEAISDSYDPSEISCDAMELYPGDDLPKVKFKIDPCYESLCHYEVEYVGNNCGDDCSAEGDYDPKGEKAQWSPANISTDEMTPDGNYKYIAKYRGRSKDCPITVNQIVPATVTGCTVSDDGVVSGTVTGANHGETVHLTIAVNDNIGQPVSVDVENIEVNSPAHPFTVNLGQQGLIFARTYLVTWHLGANNHGTCGDYTPDPGEFTVTCPSGSQSGTSATMQVTGCGGDAGCTKTVVNKNGASLSNGETVSYNNGIGTLSNAVLGNTYTVTWTRGSTSIPCDISFRENFSVTCSDANGATMPNQNNKQVNSEISLDAPEDIVGCESGNCSYDIKLRGSSTTIVNGPIANYDGRGISFTDGDASAGDIREYTLTIFSPTSSNSHDCNFDVTYAAAPPPAVCHCADYCGSGCENNITTGTVYHNGDGWSGCVFLTSASRINNNSGYTINGTPITENGNLCYGDEAACASKLAAYEPVDGGWYFKIDNIYTDIISSGYNPCAEVSPASISACSVAQTIVAPNADVTVAMTTTNCNVLGGCDYKISADGLTDKTGNFYSGNITFPGESSGSHTYSLYIKNSANATWVKCPSSFTITYSSDAYINAVLGTQYYGPKKLQYSTSGTCGIDASANTWNTWVTGTVSGYWGGTNGQINGAIKVDVPSGQWFKVNNCW